MPRRRSAPAARSSSASLELDIEMPGLDGISAGAALVRALPGTRVLTPHSEGTVRNYLSAAMRKLGARNRREAVDVATEKGWL
jgi:hypothetical protein